MAKDVYAYIYGDGLYLNLTNACTNDCAFCLRRHTDGIGGYNLWLKEEPDANMVIEQMGDLTPYDEIVFCGFGEPLLRLDVLKQVAAYAKARGKTVRVNTNGLANLYHGRDITPELAGLVDVISISLNASNAEDYLALCKPCFGLEAYEGLWDFAEKAQAHVPAVLLSIVDSIGLRQIAACQKLAEQRGLTLRVRAYTEE